MAANLTNTNKWTNNLKEGQFIIHVITNQVCRIARIIKQENAYLQDLIMVEDLTLRALYMNYTFEEFINEYIIIDDELGKLLYL